MFAQLWMNYLVITRWKQTSWVAKDLHLHLQVIWADCFWSFWAIFVLGGGADSFKPNRPRTGSKPKNKKKNQTICNRKLTKTDPTKNRNWIETEPVGTDWFGFLTCKNQLDWNIFRVTSLKSKRTDPCPVLKKPTSALFGTILVRAFWFIVIKLYITNSIYVVPCKVHRYRPYNHTNNLT